MEKMLGEKIHDIRENLKEEGIDACIFLNSSPIHDSNIEYLTKFRQTKFHAFSCLILGQEKSTLIVSGLEYDRARKQAKCDEVLNIKDYSGSLRRVFKDKLNDCKRIGIIPDLFPYKLARRLKGKKFIDVSKIMENARSVKTPAEIKLLKKSCKIAEKGVKIIEGSLQRNMTEKELALILQHELLKKGAEEMSFPTIVSSGKNSAFIHPEPSFSEREIQPGLGIIDFGVRYNGYCSDVTVPFSIGKLTDQQKKIVEVTEEAYQTAVDSLEVGKPTWKVYDEVDSLLKKRGFESKHSLGHGIGLDIHEVPNLSPKPKTKRELKEWKEVVLQEKMAFTIEPGVYVEGLGGCRIENDFLMKRGPKILTKSKLIEI